MIAFDRDAHCVDLRRIGTCPASSQRTSSKRASSSSKRMPGASNLRCRAGASATTHCRRTHHGLTPMTWSWSRSAKVWKALEFDAGFGWLSGPPEFGGGGLTPDHERQYLQLRSEFDVPSLSVFVISLGMVASTFQTFGSDEVRRSGAEAAPWRSDRLSAVQRTRCRLRPRQPDDARRAGMATSG